MTNEEQLSRYTIVNNSSKKYPNGSIWRSNSCGPFTIIAKTNRTNGKGSRIYCLCQFSDGTIVEADYTNIKTGNIKNPNHPSVCGIGYVGVGPWRAKLCGKSTREYQLWLHMMQRCYNPKNHEHSPTYRDVEVCRRWHCFQNFCEDIQHLYGYNQWRVGAHIELDKDVICERENIRPKVYSPSTCMFLPKSQNLSESTTRKNLTGHIYKAVSPEGMEYIFRNQKEFAKQHGLKPGLVSACINGTRRHHKGWRFYDEGEETTWLQSYTTTSTI